MIQNINDINNFRKENKKVYIVVDTKEKAEKIKKMLEEYILRSVFANY